MRSTTGGVVALRRRIADDLLPARRACMHGGVRDNERDYRRPAPSYDDDDWDDGPGLTDAWPLIWEIPTHHLVRADKIVLLQRYRRPLHTVRHIHASQQKLPYKQLILQ